MKKDFATCIWSAAISAALAGLTVVGFMRKIDVFVVGFCTVTAVFLGLWTVVDAIKQAAIILKEE